MLFRKSGYLFFLIQLVIVAVPWLAAIECTNMFSCALLGAKGYHAQFIGLGDGARLRDMSALVQFRADFAIGCGSCNSCRLGLAQKAAADEASASGE